MSRIFISCLWESIMKWVNRSDSNWWCLLSICRTRRTALSWLTWFLRGRKKSKCRKKRVSITSWDSFLTIFVRSSSKSCLLGSMARIRRTVWSSKTIILTYPKWIVKSQVSFNKVVSMLMMIIIMVNWKLNRNRQMMISRIDAKQRKKKNWYKAIIFNYCTTISSTTNK